MKFLITISFLFLATFAFSKHVSIDLEINFDQINDEYDFVGLTDDHADGSLNTFEKSHVEYGGYTVNYTAGIRERGETMS
jgi:hypothetical protein